MSLAAQENIPQNQEKFLLAHARSARQVHFRSRKGQILVLFVSYVPEGNTPLSRVVLRATTVFRVVQASTQGRWVRKLLHTAYLVGLAHSRITREQLIKRHANFAHLESTLRTVVPHLIPPAQIAKQESIQRTLELLVQVFV